MSSSPAEINLLSNMLNDKIKTASIDPNLIFFALILVFLYLIYLQENKEKTYSITFPNNRLLC